MINVILTILKFFATIIAPIPLTFAHVVNVLFSVHPLRFYFKRTSTLLCCFCFFWIFFSPLAHKSGVVSWILLVPTFSLLSVLYTMSFVPLAHFLIVPLFTLLVILFVSSFVFLRVFEIPSSFSSSFTKFTDRMQPVFTPFIWVEIFFSGGKFPLTIWTSLSRRNRGIIGVHGELILHYVVSPACFNKRGGFSFPYYTTESGNEDQ